MSPESYSTLNPGFVSVSSDMKYKKISGPVEVTGADSIPVRLAIWVVSMLDPSYTFTKS